MSKYVEIPLKEVGKYVGLRVSVWGYKPTDEHIDKGYWSIIKSKRSYVIIDDQKTYRFMYKDRLFTTQSNMYKHKCLIRDLL